jgi:two-component system cell cycle sensor histidine kinase/response regulator CckA
VAGDDVDIVFELLSPQRVHADAAQLEQVIVNLVANARDAMPDGGTVSIRTFPVSLPPGARADRLGLEPGEFVAIVVTDNGLGMDPETQAHVFEPFFTTKDREQGTGLGLAIAESTIRRFNGAIELQSSPQHGSRFRILLPIAPVG